MKKLTVNRLAFSNLKARKKQYTLMIIGIVLAMVFSSGIIFFISCMTTSLNELSYSSYGYQDMIMGRVTNVEAFDNSVDAGVFAEIGTAKIIGFAYTEEGRENKGFSVATYDDKALELSRQCTIEGRMPEKAGEIAIEADALVRLRMKAAVGDTVTFRFRVQNDDEYLEKDIEKTYTLVGILKDKRCNVQEYNSGKGYANIPAAIVSNDEKIEAGGKERICGYGRFGKKDKDGDYYGVFIDYQEANNLVDYAFSEYTDGNMYWNVGGGDIETKGVLAAVLAAVLTIASCVGIVNSFNTNLQDRKKQIGLLRAVGTTRRQIIKIFGREAFIIALIAAPLSVVVSYFLTKAIIHFMGENMVFAPKIWILVIGAVIGVVVVMTAALVPLSVASRISPMQSIRNIDITRKMKNKKIKTKKTFTVPKLLAQRDIAFSKGKTAAVCIMLIISFMLGSFGISFLKYTFDDFSYDLSDYNIYKDFWSVQTEFANNAGPDGYGIPNAVLNEILMLPYVDSVDCHNMANATIITDKKYTMFDLLQNSWCAFELEGKNSCPELTSDNYEKFIEEQEKYRLTQMTGEDYVAYKTYNDKPVVEAKKKFGLGDNYYNTSIETTSEDVVKSLENRVIEGKINIDRLNSGEEVILCLPQKSAFIYRTENYSYDGNPTTYVTFTLRYDVKPDGTLEYHDSRNEKVLKIFENDVHAGDEIDVSMVFDKYFGEEGINYAEEEIYSSEARQYRKTVKVGAIIDDNGDFGYTGQVITTNAGYASFGAPEFISSADVILNCECTDEINDAVCDSLDALASGNVFSYNSKFTTMKEMETQKNTIIVGFASVIILFFSVCASLINNSMTAKIREDKKQIGTLRAVGTSSSELTKAYILRLLRIFAIGFIGGFIAYLVAHFGLYFALKCMDKIDESGYLSFLIWPSIVFCILIFAVCAFNLWRQVRKQMKYSIVDNIREL